MCEKNKQPQVLMKNNIMVKAKYSISTIENRIFQVILYRLQKKNDGVLSCTITYSEFKEFIKNPNQCTINAICDTLINLRKQSIFFKKDTLWGEYGFINGFIYDEEIDAFNIEASEKVYSLLKEYLKSGYTPINLKVFLSLINPNAQRFYDLLRLWSASKSSINYKVDELKELLMLENKYSRYPDFKRRVIVPAINELNKKALMEIEFNEIKQKRKVVSIDFIVKDIDKRKYFQNEEKNDSELKLNFNCKDTIMFDIEKVIKITAAIVKVFSFDFNKYDFTQEKYYKLLLDVEAKTLEATSSKTINSKNYKYFKTVLENKIDSLDNINNKINSKPKKLIFTDYEQRDYDYDELEKKLLGWDCD